MKTLTNKYPETIELTTSINDVILCLSKLDDYNKINFYPLAYMGIFVKFQKLLFTQFKLYCIGHKSSLGYCPERRHIFEDEIELRAFLKVKSEYTDYDESIHQLSDYIFKDAPFSKLFSLEPQGYYILKHIRNHIAHESQSSYKKLLDAHIIKDDQTIGEYFAKRSKKGKIHFEELITSLYDFSNYIIEG